MKLQGLLFVAIFNLAYTQLVKGQPRQDCQTRCGNVTVEYPFGTSPGCYYAEDPSFHLPCNQTKKMFVDDMEVISISQGGQLRVWSPVTYACYNNKGHLTNDTSRLFGLGNLSLSNNNILTGVGCTSYVYLRGYGRKIQTIGCISGCGYLPEKGSCSGEGCCQIPISKNISSIYRVLPRRFEGQSNDFENFNRCTYAFLVETGKFHFSALEDPKDMRNVTEFPVVLDWSIGEKTCEQVGNKSICGGNSTCSDSTRGEGYICKCKDGYDGNPHIPNDCQGTSTFSVAH
ncbi:wall-associated receptor kinase 2-like [Arabidopsis lyrata subsp. lyrata]|uniref:wall-associated receptor kinase 2-like n=1 Tax=Arabidopsis lyrata subsp. lyrata TaxID=81972 RepID=UPI000A29A5FD|nr:wall-associated receptor kinase 2-like [Arabidopsis lyrata subsp. lyrata]|eukprot:XP_020869475.1 wall-associated receptor kinase 2-like [Arabidopsis lyrata subsp. lyrata]